MSALRARRVRRVVVAIDGSPGSRAAGAAAARLAAVLGADLAGLFVEDPTLAQLGAAALAHQVARHSHQARPVSRHEIERQLRAQATRARRALAAVAGREGVPYSFTVSRGAVTSEVVAATGEEDLVTLGRSGWSFGHPRRLGSTARALLERRPGLVLVLERGARLAPPPGVFFDGSDEAVAALELAGILARSVPGGLVVLATTEEARERAASELGSRRHLARFRGPVTSSAALRAAVDEERVGILVLPAGEGTLASDYLPALLDALRCPVLVLR